MTVKDAMSQRHTVRKYKEKALPDEIISQLNARIEEQNNTHGINMQLVTGDRDGFNTLIKLVLAKGVKNYIILAGPDREDTDEKLGYSGADLALFAQTLGLNSWWVGLTFNKGKMLEKINASGNEKVIGIIALGYGKESGKAHQSKGMEKVSHYNGDEVPVWFTEGVKAALLAPTAMNKQNFQIEGIENMVSITCSNGIFTGTDLGIVKYHFEVGAEKENFTWK